MLNERPGCFVRLGSGPAAPLHSSTYDFNDKALAVGASFWTRLVETVLKA